MLDMEALQGERTVFQAQSCIGGEKRLTQCHQGLFKCWYFFLSHYVLQLASIVVTRHWRVHLGGSIEPLQPSLATGPEVNTASSIDSTETGYPGFYPPLALWHRQK